MVRGRLPHREMSRAGTGDGIAPAVELGGRPAPRVLAVPHLQAVSLALGGDPVVVVVAVVDSAAARQGQRGSGDDRKVKQADD